MESRAVPPQHTTVLQVEVGFVVQLAAEICSDLTTLRGSAEALLAFDVSDC